MTIIKGEDIVILTKDDARKILHWIRASRMTRGQVGELGDMLDLVDELVEAVREPEVSDGYSA